MMDDPESAALNAALSGGADPIRAAALRNGVDPDLFHALVQQESGGQHYSAPGVVKSSKAGALGYTQLMPGTARSLGVDPLDPQQNLDGGARYLKQQLDTFGSVPLALAAYDAGPGSVRGGRVPNIPETRNYVRSIMGSLGSRGGASDSVTRSRQDIIAKMHGQAGSGEEGALNAALQGEDGALSAALAGGSKPAPPAAAPPMHWEGDQLVPPQGGTATPAPRAPAPTHYTNPIVGLLAGVQKQIPPVQVQGNKLNAILQDPNASAAAKAVAYAKLDGRQGNEQAPRPGTVNAQMLALRAKEAHYQARLQNLQTYRDAQHGSLTPNPSMLDQVLGGVQNAVGMVYQGSTSGPEIAHAAGSRPQQRADTAGLLPIPDERSPTFAKDAARYQKVLPFIQQAARIHEHFFPAPAQSTFSPIYDARAVDAVTASPQYQAAVKNLPPQARQFAATMAARLRALNGATDDSNAIAAQEVGAVADVALQRFMGPIGGAAGTVTKNVVGRVAGKGLTRALAAGVKTGTELGTYGATGATLRGEPEQALPEFTQGFGAGVVGGAVASKFFPAAADLSKGPPEPGAIPSTPLRAAGRAIGRGAVTFGVANPTQEALGGEGDPKKLAGAAAGGVLAGAALHAAEAAHEAWNARGARPAKAAPPSDGRWRGGPTDMTPVPITPVPGHRGAAPAASAFEKPMAPADFEELASQGVVPAKRSTGTEAYQDVVSGHKPFALLHPGEVPPGSPGIRIKAYTVGDFHPDASNKDDAVWVTVRDGPQAKQALSRASALFEEHMRQPGLGNPRHDIEFGRHLGYDDADIATFLKQNYGSERLAQDGILQTPSEPPAPPATSGFKPTVWGDTAQTGTRNFDVKVRYAAVPADMPITSHTPGFAPNPDYPTDLLQNRNRSAAPSVESTTAKLQDLRPSWLGANPHAQNGAPIVGPDGFVESGNGRQLILRAAYDQNHPKGQQYRDWLLSNASKFGLDPTEVAKLKNPTLIQVRQTELSPADRREFAREANSATTDEPNPTEIARGDAKALTPDLLRRFDANSGLKSATNRGFVSQFIRDVVPDSERAGLLQADKTPSKKGYDRVRNAFLYHTYGSQDLIDRLASDPDDEIANVSRGMELAAPAMAQAESGIRAGTLHPLSIAGDLTKAAERLVYLRGKGIPVAAHLTAPVVDESMKLSPEQQTILAALDERKRSSKQIAGLLSGYAETLAAHGAPGEKDLFGNEHAPTKADVLDATLARLHAQSGLGSRPAAAEPSGQPAAAPGPEVRQPGNQAGPGTGSSTPGEGGVPGEGPGPALFSRGPRQQGAGLFGDEEHGAAGEPPTAAPKAARPEKAVGSLFAGEPAAGDASLTADIRNHLGAHPQGLTADELGQRLVKQGHPVQRVPVELQAMEQAGQVRVERTGRRPVYKLGATAKTATEPGGHLRMGPEPDQGALFKGDHEPGEPHVYPNVQAFRDSGVMAPTRSPGDQIHRAILDRNGRVYHWTDPTVYHAQMAHRAGIEPHSFGVMAHRGGGELHGGITERDAYAMNPNERVDSHFARAFRDYGGKNSTLFSHGPAPPFYSQLSKSIGAAPFEKASGGKWRTHLAGSGVKADEMKWTGTDDFLAARADKPITRAELAQHAAENAVQVKEVVKGSVPWYPFTRSAPTESYTGREWHGGHAIIKEGRNGQYYYSRNGESWTVPAESLEAAKAIAGENNGAATKWGGYALPEGRNYRELLLTLPESPEHRAAKQKMLADAAQAAARLRELGLSEHATPYQISRALGGVDAHIDTPENRRAWDEARRLIAARANTGAAAEYTGHTFTGGHFDEPNVLAFVRFNEMTTRSGKRVLNIENVQSDWQSAGKKQGYYDPQKPWQVFDMHSGKVHGAFKTEAEAREFSKTAPPGNDFAHGAEQQPPAVPEHPMQGTWQETLARRVVRWAAEHGFDGVTLTPPHIQQARGEDAPEMNGRILPDYLRKFGKKFGAALGTEELPLESEKPLRGTYPFEQAEQDYRAILRDVSDRTGEDHATIDNAVAHNRRNAVEEINDAEWNRLREGRERIQTLAGTGPGPTEFSIPPRHTPATFLPITDRMRETATREGFPLFQAKPGGTRADLGPSPAYQAWFHHTHEADFGTGPTHVMDYHGALGPEGVAQMAADPGMRRLAPVVMRTIERFAKAGLTEEQYATLTRKGLGFARHAHADRGSGIFGFWQPGPKENGARQAAVMVNPLAGLESRLRTARTPMEAAQQVVDSVIHELAHHAGSRVEGAPHQAAMRAFADRVGGRPLREEAQALAQAFSGEGGDVHGKIADDLGPARELYRSRFLGPAPMGEGTLRRGPVDGDNLPGGSPQDHGATGRRGPPGPGGGQDTLFSQGPAASQREIERALKNAYLSSRSLLARGMSRLEAEAPEAMAAVRKSAGAAELSTLMLRQTGAEINRLLGPGGWQQFLALQTEENVRGQAIRWAEHANDAPRLPDTALQGSAWKNPPPQPAGSPLPPRKLLGMIQNKLNFGNVVGPADEYQAAGRLDLLRTYLRNTYLSAAGAAGSYTQNNVPAHWPSSWRQDLEAHPNFHRALNVYRVNLEEPLREAHAANDGVELDPRHLGRHGVYLPLTALDAQGAKIGGSGGTPRLFPWSKPRNPNAGYRTGLAENYAHTPEALGEALRGAMTANSRAAMWNHLEDMGLVRTLQPGQRPAGTMPWAGYDYPTVTVPVGSARTFVNGRHTFTQGARTMEMPTWVHQDLKPMIEKGTSLDEETAASLMGSATNAAVLGPTIGVVHGNNLGRTLVSNTPVIGKTLAGNTPFTKGMNAAVRIARASPYSPENFAAMQDMARLALLHPKQGTVTLSRKWAEETGAKFLNAKNPLSVMQAALYGPDGLDNRARLVAYQVAHELDPQIQDRELVNFMEQFGQYHRELQGRLQRALGKTGLSPFYEAGRRMTANGVNALLGTSPLPTSSRSVMRKLSLRLAGALTAGGAGMVATWMMANKAINGYLPGLEKTPDDAPPPRFGMIGVWDKDHKRVQYVDLFSALGTNISRGARATGLSGYVNTTAAGGSPGQGLEVGGKDILNSVAHPVLGGPPVRFATNAALAAEPALTALRDTHTGRPLAQLRSSGVERERPGLPQYGANLRQALTNINPGTSDLLSNQGAGEETQDQHWLRAVLNMAIPGVVGPNINPVQQKYRLRQAERAADRPDRRRSPVAP